MESKSRFRWMGAAAIGVALAALSACQNGQGAPSEAGIYTPPSGGNSAPPAVVTFALPTYAPPQGQQPPMGGQPQGGQQGGMPGGQQGGMPQGGQQPPMGGQQGGMPSGQQGGMPQGGQQLTGSYPVPAPSSGFASGGMIDLHNLIIGDDNIVSQPTAGGLWSCQTTFTGGGAHATGAWYHSDGTYDLLAKPVVDGSVTWPHELLVTVQGDQRAVTGNDLPSHPTGKYPIDSGDDAYQYDRNPNIVAAQSVLFELTANPQPNSQPMCAGGSVGFLLSGSWLFNAVDAGGRDAVATEIQDSCGGHPQSSGAYHYHGYTPCVNGDAKQHALIGYALDGFGLYGPYDDNGGYFSNADLDVCHGHVHTIEWDGQQAEMYHYHANYEFPYTVGCFRGTGIRVNNEGGQQPGGGQQPPGGGQQPPGGGQQPPPGGGSGGQLPPPPQP